MTACPMAWMALYRKSHFAPAFLFLGREERRALQLLYAVCRVLDDAVDEGTQADPAGFLAAWRAVFASGRAEPVHGFGCAPLAVAFLDAAARFGIPLDVMEELIEKGVGVDLTGARFGTPMDLESYCYGVAGTVGIACLPLFGVPVDESRHFAARLGVAVQWVNIIRDVRKDARAGRCYLPLEHMALFGYTEKDLAGGIQDERFVSLMRHEVAAARGHFRRARELEPAAWRRQLRPARVMGRIYEDLLDKVERKGFSRPEARTRLNLLEKMWSVWRAIA